MGFFCVFFVTIMTNFNDSQFQSYILEGLLTVSMYRSGQVQARSKQLLVGQARKWVRFVVN